MSATGVRATRAFTNNASEYVVTLEYQGAGQTPIYSTVGYTSADLISISYRDPNVLYLESLGQYIMLCARVRLLRSTQPGISPHNSISDIVAFVSSDSTFATCTGPFWIARHWRVCRWWDRWGWRWGPP